MLGWSWNVCLLYLVTIAFSNSLIVAVYPWKATETVMRILRHYTGRI